jgi:hypothetical protein
MKFAAISLVLAAALMGAAPMMAQSAAPAASDSEIKLPNGLSFYYGISPAALHRLVPAAKCNPREPVYWCEVPIKAGDTCAKGDCQILYYFRRGRISAVLMDLDTQSAARLLKRSQAAMGAPREDSLPTGKLQVGGIAYIWPSPRGQFQIVRAFGKGENGEDLDQYSMNFTSSESEFTELKPY